MRDWDSKCIMGFGSFGWWQMGGAGKRADDDSVYSGPPTRDRRPNRRGPDPWVRHQETANWGLLCVRGCWCCLQGTYVHDLHENSFFNSLVIDLYCNRWYWWVGWSEGGGERCSAGERAGDERMGPESWLCAWHWRDCGEDGKPREPTETRLSGTEK